MLSKGHAAPVLYAALAEAGVFPESRVMTLREFSSELEGHPTPRIPGVDAATGSLGQGFRSARVLRSARDSIRAPTRVYVLMGDGEMAEGQVWEAAEFAGHYKLDNLTVLADVNALGQSEPTMYQHDMEIYRKKFEAEGWATEVIDGHDVAAVLAALDRAKATKGRPQAIIARTIKGHGFSFMLPGKETGTARRFRRSSWRTRSRKWAARRLWFHPTLENLMREHRCHSLPISPLLPRRIMPDGKPVATREAYGFALKRLGAVNPQIVAISGDVKNSTFSEFFGDALPGPFLSGLHRGAEYGERGRWAGRAGARCRFLIRLRAFCRARTTRCAWRPSAGATSTCADRTAAFRSAKTGHRRWRSRTSAMFRAVHGSAVFYPSDAISAERLTETMARRSGINYLRTSRPKTPILYSKDEKFPMPGFKVVRQSPQDRVTVIGAGITLHEALKAADELKSQGTAIRVIDLYCVKPIDGKAIAEQIQATGGRLVTVEDHWPEGGVGEAVLSALAQAGVAPTKSRLLAVRDMPHSGKPDELVDAFGISARHIAEAVREIA